MFDVLVSSARSLFGTPMAYRIAGLIAAAASLLAGGLLLVEGSRLALRHAEIERLRVTQLQEAALAFTDALAPVRRLAETGAFLDIAREAERARDALRLVEIAAPPLRRLALHAPDGRVIATTSAEAPPVRGDLLAFAADSGPGIALGRFRRDALGLEVVVVARDLPVAQRVVVVADIALATAAGPNGASWSLVLQDGTITGPPTILPKPALAADRSSSLFAPLGDAIMALWGTGPVYEAPLPGTDALVRVLLPASAGPLAMLGALTAGGCLSVFGLGLMAWAGLSLIREVRALRAAHDSDARLQHILAAIAQDARTPLNSIYGFATLLTDNDLHPEQAEWASRIQHASQMLNMMLESLVEVGDRAFEDIEINTSTTRPDLLLRETLSLFDASTWDKHIELTTRIHSSVLEYFELDEQKLQRILFHVISNAVKYTQDGEIIITARVDDGKQDQQNGRILVIDVEDTGPGVPEEERELIFEKFRRGGRQPISSNGLGLGLFVARGLARRMGGDVTHRPREGGGSIFTITLPTRHARILPTSLALRGRSALLVGFDAAHRARLSATLHRLGFVTETAPDGFLGLGAAERMAVTRGDLDILLLDEGLVAMPTHVFVRRLRSMQPFRKLPIILVRKQDGDATADRSLFAAVIRDDIAVPELEQVLLRLFGLSPSGPAAQRRSMARVLVVEDNHVNRSLFVEILKRAGHSVFTASDATSALHMLSRINIDLAVLDIALPGMDGIELAAKLKADARTRSLPLIAVTAQDDATTVERARNAGIGVILPKPLDARKFLVAIEEMLKRQRMTPPDDIPPGDTDELVIDPAYLEARFLDVGPARTRAELEELITGMSQDMPRLSEMLGSGALPTDTTQLVRLRELAEELGAVQVDAELEALSAALDHRDAAAAASHAEAIETLWSATRAALLRTLRRCEERYERGRTGSSDR